MFNANDPPRDRNTTRIDSRKNENNHRTLVGKVQDSYFGCMQRLGVATERLSRYGWHRFELAQCKSTNGGQFTSTRPTVAGNDSKYNVRTSLEIF